MQNYTDQDVHVAWLSPGSRHFKKRKHLNFIDYSEPEKIFKDALQDNKQIVCIVSDVQRLNHYSIPRYQLALRIRVRHHNNSTTPTIGDIKNYWRLWDWDFNLENTTLALAFSIPPFITTAVLPCTKIKRDKQLEATPNKDNILAPRVIIAPKFGNQYVHNLDKSVRPEELINWVTPINAAVQKVYKLFVDSEGELV